MNIDWKAIRYANAEKLIRLREVARGIMDNTNPGTAEFNSALSDYMNLEIKVERATQSCRW